jgi:drug/metabolite transporter (DMT)-like permease
MWLMYALITFVIWGIWGAFTDKPTTYSPPFPSTLIYVVWALTTILPAGVVLAADNFKVARSGKAISYGMLVGLTGCGGQMVLFKVLAMGGPAYLVFPILALQPLVTALLSFTFLGERTGKLGAAGVVLAVVSIVVLSIPSGGATGNVKGYLWLILTLGIMVSWGAQAYFMKVASNLMSSASVCFYNTASALVLVPVALWLTDFQQQIEWRQFHGPYLAAIVQMLNAIGFVTYVMAFKHGKALIIAPLCNAFPLLTVFITLGLEHRWPRVLEAVGIVACKAAATFMVVDEQWHQPPAKAEEGGGLPMVETPAQAGAGEAE